VGITVGEASPLEYVPAAGPVLAAVIHGVTLAIVARGAVGLEGRGAASCAGVTDSVGVALGNGLALLRGAGGAGRALEVELVAKFSGGRIHAALVDA